MLMLDTWRPDMELAGQAGYFPMSRLGGNVPGLLD